MACEMCKTKERDSELKGKLIARVNRIAGQVIGISKMIEDDRYCGDILIQLSAINSAIRSLEGEILSNHMHTCVVNDIKNDNLAVVDELIDLVKRLR